MRLIDADAMLARLEEWNTSDSTDKALYNFTLHRILEQPTIEPRKKGMWLFKERREPVYDISGVKTWGIAYMCPECEFIHTVIEDFGQYVYCPNCGAEMREDGAECLNT